MGRTKEHQCLSFSIENLLLDHRGCGSISTLYRSIQITWCGNGAPVDGIVGCNNTDPPTRRQFGVDRAHFAKELFVDWRVERAWYSGVAPNMLQLPDGHGFTVHETIEERLVQGIAEFNDSMTMSFTL